MNTNDPGGSRTRDLRIKSQSEGSRADNNLAGSPSDSGAVRERPGPSFSGPSATNPTTTLVVETAESDVRNALALVEAAHVEIRPGEWRYNLTSSEIERIHIRLGAAVAKLSAERASRRALLRQVLQRRRVAGAPAMASELEQMERTNRELSAGPNAIIEEVIDATL